MKIIIAVLIAGLFIIGMIESDCSNCKSGKITKSLKEDCSNCKGRGLTSCNYSSRWFEEKEPFTIHFGKLDKGPNGELGFWLRSYCVNGYLKGTNEGRKCPRCGGKDFQNCESCDGYGYVTESKSYSCPECDGYGKLLNFQKMFN